MMMDIDNKCAAGCVDRAVGGGKRATKDPCLKQISRAWFLFSTAGMQLPAVACSWVSIKDTTSSHERQKI